MLEILIVAAGLFLMFTCYWSGHDKGYQKGFDDCEEMYRTAAESLKKASTQPQEPQEEAQ